MVNAILKNLPVYSFNALIIPILRDCLPNYQIVGISMGTTCAPLVADLFLSCYERDFMLSFSEDNQPDVI